MEELLKFYLEDMNNFVYHQLIEEIDIMKSKLGIKEKETTNDRKAHKEAQIKPKNQKNITIEEAPVYKAIELQDMEMAFNER